MAFELIIGPPGCGKTTKLATLVKTHVEQGHRPLVCSLTNTAAHEVAGRNLPVDRSAIGTLHSHARRALDGPAMVEGHLADFSTEHPEYELDDGNTESDPYQSRPNESLGDDCRSLYDLLRARCTPRAAWPQHVLGFAGVWEGWKQENSYSDFGDLIHYAAQLKKPAPANPDVIMVDEAQDHSRAELDLLKEWSRHCQRTILVGDPHQALYTWRGAHPQMFTHPETTPAHQEVLSQSYRVPRAVHAVATEWIKQLDNYKEFEYRPRPADGSATQFQGGGSGHPAAVVDLAETHLAAGSTVMICSTAGYLLYPTLNEMRSRILPFSNPWKEYQRDWNPMGGGKVSLWRSGCASTRVHETGFWRRVSSLIETTQNVSGEHSAFPFGHNVAHTSIPISTVWLWVQPMLAKGTLRRGAKKEIEDLAKGDSGISFRPFSAADVDRWFEPEAAGLLHRHLAGEIPVNDVLCWWRDRLLAARQRAAEYAIKIAIEHGAAVLEADPKLWIGTIHSFKGSEADVVIVYPDLSPAGAREWMTPGEGRDAVLRMFYVALTRAREAVYVCLPRSEMSADVWRYVA